MREIRLRWSPRRSGWFVHPGDEIADTGAEPFRVSWQKLIDPDLFRQASMEHDWPRITDAANHRARLRDAALDKHIADNVHPGCKEQVVRLSLALHNDDLSLEEYFERMEILAG